MGRGNMCFLRLPRRVTPRSATPCPSTSPKDPSGWKQMAWRWLHARHQVAVSRLLGMACLTLGCSVCRAAAGSRGTSRGSQSCQPLSGWRGSETRTLAVPPLPAGCPLKTAEPQSPNLQLGRKSFLTRLLVKILGQLFY